MPGSVQLERPLGPAGEAIIKTQAEDIEQQLAVLRQTCDLAELKANLDELRRYTALTARKSDIEHVRKLDLCIDRLLSAIGENPELVMEAVRKTLEKGDVRAIKDLACAISDLAEVRERLLGFDPERVTEKSKRKLRLQVVWRGSGGQQASEPQAALQIEAPG